MFIVVFLYIVWLTNQKKRSACHQAIGPLWVVTTKKVYSLYIILYVYMSNILEAHYKIKNYEIG